MSFKIDTKEKFTVITPLTATIDKAMTAELSEIFLKRLRSPIPHCIVNLESVTSSDSSFFNLLLEMHERFYQENNSLVVCGISPDLYRSIPDEDMTEVLNITPTESEAWDIVQMEEMEREFMRDEDGNNQ